MMLFKLSIRNLKKSIQSYVIYFATLIIGVAIFYIFNAIGTQTVMLSVSGTAYEVVELLKESMSIVSVFVSGILGFLIVYASTFMMKRRKKEFGIYMLLGMKKRKIALLMVIETLLIGVISLVIGLIIGMALSQCMSVIVVNMFEADMSRFKFMISSEAIVKTLCYFAVMYIVVMFLNTVVVGKTRLINLLNASKKNEENHIKNKYVCIVVFLIAIALLGTAYYRVTAGFNEIKDLKDIGIEIIKGIVGTFALFWSLSGILLALVQKRKKFYYKGLNCFSTRELSSRVNTTVFSGGVICLLLFFTICILSSAVAISTSLNKSLEKNAPASICISRPIAEDEGDKYLSIEDIMDKAEIDKSLFGDSVYTTIYESDVTFSEGMDLENDRNSDMDEVYYISFLRNENMDVMKLSEYNKLAKLYGKEEISLKDNEYAVVVNYSAMTGYYNGAMEAGHTIELLGKTYTPAYKKAVEGIIEMSANDDNVGVLVVADSVDFSGLKVSDSLFAANYADCSKENDAKLDAYFNSDEMNDRLGAKNGIDTPEIWTQKELKDMTIGMSAMMVFIGSYLGLVFLISSAAILSLKELSQAADNREKYRALRRIGVDEKMISKSLLAQSGVYFGIPLVIAIIHSVFGMQTSDYIMSVYDNSGMLPSIIKAGAVILGIYGLYFVLTYFCSRKIISE